MTLVFRAGEMLYPIIYITQAIIFTLNAGADYQPAGPLWLAGGVKSYRTPLTKDIDTFKKFTVSAAALILAFTSLSILYLAISQCLHIDIQQLMYCNLLSIPVLPT